MKDVRPESGRGIFRGLKLSPSERREVTAWERAGNHRRVVWIRLRALLLLDDGKSVAEVAKALGTYPRTVRRVGWRFLDGGLHHAIAEEERPKPDKMLSERQRTAIVAMVCTPPPEGRSRWTTALIAREAMGRGVVEKVGRETIRLLLRDHDLKPWREKNVVRSGAQRRVRRADGGAA